MSSLFPVVIRDDGRMSVETEGGTQQTLDLQSFFTCRHEMAPQGCRFARQQDGRDVFVVEQPPCVRTIHLCATADDQWRQLVESGRTQKYRLPQKAKEQREFQLAFPFVVFMVTVDMTGEIGLRVFFRDQPIMSLSDHLFFASMSSDDTFLLQMRMEDIPPQDRLPAGLAQRAIEAFWQQEFSLEFGARYRQSIPFLETLWDWQEHSRGDYLWMLRASWTPCGTLKDQVEEAPRNPSEDLSLHAHIHRALHARVLAGGPSLSQETGDYLPLPTFSVFLRNMTVRLGDILYATVPERARDRGYVVRAFFMSRKNRGCVLAQFDGEEEMFPLGTQNDGLRGWKYAEDQANPFIKEVPESLVEDIPICRGIRFCLKNSDDICLSPGTYTVRQVYVDKDGDTLVALERMDEPVYVTYQGGKLFPSVAFGVPRLHKQRFSFLEAEMHVGQIVEITADHPSLAKGLLARVASLRKDEQSRDRFLVVFEGMEKDEIVLYEHGKLLVQWKNCLHMVSETRGRLDQQEFNLSECPWFFLRVNCPPFQAGKAYRMVIIDVSRKEGRHPLDVDIFVEGMEKPLSLIANGKRKLSAGDLNFVLEEFTDLVSIFSALHERGKVVGRDEANKSLKIGDLVRITEQSFNDVRFDRRVKELTGVIVHHDDFLYVMYGRDLNGNGYDRDRPPRNYRSLPRDCDIPRRIQLVYPRHCRLVASLNL